MEDTILKNRKSLFSKLDTVINNIKKIDNRAQGYQFTYVTLEDILKTISEAANKTSLMVNTMPEWCVNKQTGEPIYEIAKDGKEFFVNGLMQFSITDSSTGYTEYFKKLAAGKGTDPGQAVGSAESYAIRQFLNKTFRVEVEREDDVSDSIITFDRKGDPVKAISSSEINEVAKTIVSKTGDASKLRGHSAEVLIAYNEHYKTNHGKLSEFPSTDLKELLTYIKAYKFKDA